MCYDVTGVPLVSVQCALTIQAKNCIGKSLERERDGKFQTSGPSSERARFRRGINKARLLTDESPQKNRFGAVAYHLNKKNAIDSQMPHNEIFVGQMSCTILHIM
jgi:hypothetical protein